MGYDLVMMVVIDLFFVGWESEYAPFYPEIMAFGFGFGFSDFSVGGGKITLMLMAICLMMFQFTSLRLQTASAERWSEIENDWVEWYSWFDPNGTRFMNFKEYHLHGGISQRCEKCVAHEQEDFDFLLRVDAARLVEAKAEEVEAKEAVGGEVVAKEAAEEDGWEDI